MENKERQFPLQKQELPGSERQMQPRPVVDDPDYKASGKLKDKVAFITGGDSGIGKAVAILFAREGAKVAIVYLDEQEDADETKTIVKKYGGILLQIPGDISKEAFCKEAIQKTVDKFGKIDILVNNAAQQIVAETLQELETENLVHTFEVNIFSMFWLTKAALKHSQ